MELTESELVRSIDQTDLNPTASDEEIAAFAEQARAYGFRSVAIMPSWIPLATHILGGSQTTVLAAIGFPLGTCTTAAKVEETKWATANGPHDIEIDMVMNTSMFKSGCFDFVRQDIQAVRDAAAGHILKSIIEVPLLTPEEIAIASRISEEAGADYVKTSTGFKYLTGWRPSTVKDVEEIKAAVGSRLKIKVAGGITNLSEALAVLIAGASRIGTSRGHVIVQQYREDKALQSQ